MDVKNITKGLSIIKPSNSKSAFNVINQRLGQKYKLGVFPHAGDEMKKEAEANAQLFSEAFNVANETGLSPRQFVGQKEILLKALKQLYVFANGGKIVDNQTIIHITSEAINSCE